MKVVWSLKALVWGWMETDKALGPGPRTPAGMYMASDLGHVPLVANYCPQPGPSAGLTTMALSRAELGPDSR